MSVCLVSVLHEYTCILLQIKVSCVECKHYCAFLSVFQTLENSHQRHAHEKVNLGTMLTFCVWFVNSKNNCHKNIMKSSFSV